MDSNATNFRYNFDSFDLIFFVKQKFKILAIIGVTAAIISIIVSLTIKNKYQSTVILFPTTQGSVSKSLITNDREAKDIMEFGKEAEVEQMLQALASDEIRNRVISKFDLMKHYGINPNSKYKYTMLGQKYESNINVKRTEFMSVQINVMDEDAKFAADMANTISNLLDTVIDRMQKERAVKALKIVEDEYRYMEKQIGQIEDSLTKIRQLGVNDYQSQAEVFNAAYAKALAEGKNEAARSLEAKLNVLSKYGSAYLSMTDFLKYQKEALSDLKGKYAQAKMDAEQTLPHKYVVNSANPSERKAYPVRSLIVLVSTITTTILALLALIIIDIFKSK